MKNWLALILAALMVFSLTVNVVAENPTEDENEILSLVLDSDAPFTKQSVKGKYKKYNKLGVKNEIASVWSNDDGYVFLARVYYGADFYEKPQIDVYVGIGTDGIIKGVKVGNYIEHTQQFLDQVTPEYLHDAYVGQTASPSLIADAVSGATFSSDAVLYAVRLSSNYSANVFKAGESNDQPVEIKRLMSLVPGTYEPVAIDASFTSENGEVQYAAAGKTDDGTAFCALIVKSSFTPTNPDNDMLVPTYQIWIDTETNKIFEANMMSGHFYEGFEMPQDMLKLYYDVEITAADAFDAFDSALITDAPEYIVTSATGSFPDTMTGATPEGNDTSRSVKNCFVTAAQYYDAHRPE